MLVTGDAVGDERKVSGETQVSPTLNIPDTGNELFAKTLTLISTLILPPTPPLFPPPPFPTVVVVVVRLTSTTDNNCMGRLSRKVTRKDTPYELDKGTSDTAILPIPGKTMIAFVMISIEANIDIGVLTAEPEEGNVIEAEEAVV